VTFPAVAGSIRRSAFRPVEHTRAFWRGTTTSVEQGSPVANIKSQIKRNKQNEKRRLRNKAVRSELRTRVKGAEAAAGGDNALAAANAAMSKIDKAAGKGVIHKNAAARKKSRLMKRLARLAG
jgi:small subunit ribosomal protein S20